MRTIWLALMPMLFSSCMHKKNFYYYAIDTHLTPKRVYSVNFSWPDFESNFQVRTDRSCVYHVFDFNISPDGLPFNISPVAWSSDTLQTQSQAALKKWQFPQSDMPIRQARAGFIYNHHNQVTAFMFNRQSPIYHGSASPTAPLESIRPLNWQTNFHDGEVQDQLSGFVDVSFTINNDGRVDQPKIINAFPPGLYDEAGLATVSHWTFPALQKQQSGIVRISYLIDGPNSCTY
ncbi:energy transducer TonB [Pseudobacteriovorax antillogorgiicola]|uniref:TonB family C-terminal domain-containing protein n=1 Tax=Pseudobacteriovorax antillogorgiicola TaxID=1513793 RepID=A0A1Y6C616_9BACT|nr:energy transducer TonB [Pseudobacteriovorax antillogorgiicola]TCS49359.1 TonB family protein [Pseudobacteriovorax antillogorgiicola]SMF47546.1 TonB family C-terminal domain-containing protein [Pseudobacteriovorax antillogorgiicola]